MDTSDDGTGTTTTQQRDKTSSQLTKVEGIYIPSNFETNRPLKEHIQCVRTMEMRDDDVLLCVYPRSGSHWTWEMCSMLLAHTTDHGKRTKEHYMLEATSVEDLHLLPSPRVLNTHLPAPLLPAQVKGKKVKVVHVYRNVKDVFVSQYHFAIHWEQSEYKPTLDEFEKFFLSDMAPLGTYFNNMKLMDDFIKDNPQVPVFNLAYEDMTEDPQGTIKRLGDFLGVEPEPSLCVAIPEACSFEKLRLVDNERQRPEHVKSRHLYRKGKVGDWKNFMSVAQSERFDDAMKQLQECDFRFRFEL